MYDFIRRSAAFGIAAVLVFASVTTVLAQELPTVTTAIHLSGDELTNYDGGNVALASEIHDWAQVTTSTNPIPSGSSLRFDLWTGSDCGSGTFVDSETVTGVGDDSLMSESRESSGTSGQTNTDKLHAGDYSFLVTFISGNNTLVDDAVAGCETVEVDKADPDVTTTIRDTADDSAVGANVPLGSDLYDEATVTGIETSGFEPTGSVTFTFYGDNTAGNSNTGDCTDANTTDFGTVALSGSDPSTVQ